MLADRRRGHGLSGEVSGIGGRRVMVWKFEKENVEAMLLGKDSSLMSEGIAAQVGAKAHTHKHVSPDRDLVAVSGQRLMLNEVPRTTFLRQKDFQNLVDATTSAFNNKPEIQKLLLEKATSAKAALGQNQFKQTQHAAKFTLKFAKVIGRAEVWTVPKDVPVKQNQFNVNYVFYILYFNTVREDLWIIQSCFPVEESDAPKDSPRFTVT
jgi:hypothetical protein